MPDCLKEYSMYQMNLVKLDVESILLKNIVVLLFIYRKMLCCMTMLVYYACRSKPLKNKEVHNDYR